MSLELIEFLRSKEALLVADLQGFLRVIGPDNKLIYAEWPEKGELLSLLDVLKTDAVEAEYLTGEGDHRTAARALADLGPREVVLTHAEGMLVYADDRFHEAAFHPRQVAGRSGRGDTCIASYVAKRLSAPPEEAIIWAAAVTSLKLESGGPVQREIAEVEALVQQRYRS